MNRAKLIAAPIAATVLLAGCATDEPNVRQGLSPTNVPVVTQQLMTYDLSAPSGALSSEQTRALGEWFDTADVRYGDRVSIDAPQGGVPARIRAQVQGVLAEDGLMMFDVGQITEAPVPARTVRIVIARASASVPGCPDYDSVDNVTYSNETSGNFGCAVNSALAAMIADPNDLLSGKPYSGTDAERSAVVIAKKRAGIGTESVTNSTGTVGSGN